MFVMFFANKLKLFYHTFKLMELILMLQMNTNTLYLI